jgi:peptidoglycan-associated lipoprotein
MRIGINATIALFLAIAAASPAMAVAQTTQPAPTAPSAPAPSKPYRSELALDYSYLRGNAPPGGCSCFNLNGGSATFAWSVKPAAQFALVADITAVHAGSVTNSGYSLTLSAYTVGGRYLPRMGHLPMQPFGQVLVGMAHGSGTLVQGKNPATANAGAAFAANLGGGLDLRASKRVSIRMIEADYLVTTIDNGANNHQNILRISSGVVLRF